MKKKHYLLVSVGAITIGMIIAILLYLQESRLILLGKYYVDNNLSIKITDEERNEYIKSILSDFVVPEERTVVEDGCMVVIDYTTYVDDSVVNTKTDKGGIIGSGFFGLEFEQRLIGTELGKNVCFEIDYPIEYEDVVLAGNHFRFNVNIKRIVEFVYPILTDEFVAQNLEYNSVNSFYIGIESDLCEIKLQEKKS